MAPGRTVRRIDSERKSSFDEILADRLILETFDFRTNFFISKRIDLE